MKKPIDYFDSAALRENLKDKTVRGGLAGAAGQIASTLVTLASLPVLARLLNPADFGLVAMVTVFTNFAAMFVDSGLSMATVQRSEISRQQSTNLFWISGALGLLIGIVVAAASPAIAWFYGRPELIMITLALSSSFLMAGLTVQHRALMTRGMQFHQIASIGVASRIAGVAAAIAWAWWFHGQPGAYWALVLMPLATSLSRLVGAWLVCRWRPGFPRRGAGTLSMIQFGANLTGFRFINYVCRNLDKLLLAQFCPIEVVGGYDRVYRLFMFPMQNINGTASSVATPALSRAKDNDTAYRGAYRKLLGATLMLSMPIAAFTAVSSDVVTEVVLGPPWLEFAPVLMWLAIAGVGHAVGNTTGWLYQSQGRGVDMLRWGAFGGALTIVSISLSAPWGVMPLAITYSLLNILIIAPASLWWVGRRGPVSTSDIYHAAAVPAAVSALIAVSSAMVGALGPELALPNLTTRVAAAVVVWGLAAWLTRDFTGLGALRSARNQARSA